MVRGSMAPVGLGRAASAAAVSEANGDAAPRGREVNQAGRERRVEVDCGARPRPSTVVNIVCAGREGLRTRNNEKSGLRPEFVRFFGVCFTLALRDPIFCAAFGLARRMAHARELS